MKNILSIVLALFTTLTFAQGGFVEDGSFAPSGNYPLVHGQHIDWVVQTLDTATFPEFLKIADSTYTMIGGIIYMWDGANWEATKPFEVDSLNIVGDDPKISLNGLATVEDDRIRMGYYSLMAGNNAGSGFHNPLVIRPLNSSGDVGLTSSQLYNMYQRSIIIGGRKVNSNPIKNSVLIGATDDGLAGFNGTHSSQYSVAIGYLVADQAATEGSVFLGYQAGAGILSDYVISIGYASGFSASGNHSIFMGYGSGAGNNGDNVIALGERAGNSNAGSDLIAIGTKAGEGNEGDNVIVIGKHTANHDHPDNSISIGTDVLGQSTNSINFPDYDLYLGLTNKSDQWDSAYTSIRDGLVGGAVTAAEINTALNDIGTASLDVRQDGERTIVGTKGLNDAAKLSLGKGVAFGGAALRFAEGFHDANIPVFSDSFPDPGGFVVMGEKAGFNSEIYESVVIGNFTGTSNQLSPGDSTGTTYLGGSVIIGNHAAQSWGGVDQHISNSIGIGTKAFELNSFIKNTIAIGADAYADGEIFPINHISMGNRYNVNDGSDTIYDNINIGHSIRDLKNYQVLIGNDLDGADYGDSAIAFPDYDLYLGSVNKSDQWNAAYKATTTFVVDTMLTVGASSGGADYKNIKEAVIAATKLKTIYNSSSGETRIEIIIRNDTTYNYETKISGLDLAGIVFTTNSDTITYRPDNNTGRKKFFEFENCSNVQFDDFSWRSSYPGNLDVWFISTNRVSNLYFSGGNIDSITRGFSLRNTSSFRLSASVSHKSSTLYEVYGVIDYNSAGEVEGTFDGMDIALACQEGSTVTYLNCSTPNYLVSGVQSRGGRVVLLTSDFTKDGTERNTDIQLSEFDLGFEIPGMIMIQPKNGEYTVLGGTSHTPNTITDKGIIFQVGEEVPQVEYFAGTGIGITNDTITALSFGGTVGNADSLGFIPASEYVNFTDVGDLNITGSATFSGSIASGSNIFLGGGGGVRWSGRSMITSPTDGRFKLSNSTQGGFDLLQFGGTTNSYPALKRSSTELQVRLADDSDYSNFRAGVITATGGDSTNWNTAFGWGDHSTQGYLTTTPNMQEVFEESGSGFTAFDDQGFTLGKNGDDEYLQFNVNGFDLTSQRIQLLTYSALVWGSEQVKVLSRDSIIISTGGEGVFPDGEGMARLALDSLGLRSNKHIRVNGDTLATRDFVRNQVNRGMDGTVTGDDTPTAVLSIPVEAEEIEVYKGIVTAQSGDDKKAWTFEVAVKNLSGSAGFLGSPVYILDGVGDVGMASADISLDISNDRLELTVTGVASETVNWEFKLTKLN